MALSPTFKLASGPVLAVLAGGLAAAVGLPGPAVATAAVTGLCAGWWVFEPIHIAATSLVPFAAFPLLGVLDHKAVATAYGHTLILLLLGGFMLSTAMARSGAHRRVAVGMIRLTGSTSQRRIVLGFMLATALCSMWISNTATVLMLLPVALAVIEADRLRHTGGSKLGAALLLGMAYAASIGGMGTPVGTPPNVVFLGIYKEATGVDIGFAQWMGIGLPVVAVLLPLAWLWVSRSLGKGGALPLPQLDAWRPAEARVLSVFGLTALAWVTRAAPGGGWSGLLREHLGVSGAGDATVALAAVVAMFLLPDGEGKGERLLNWSTAREIPWGLLILFGGGIAIARAFEQSGLSAALGEGLSGLASWPLLAMVSAICLAVTFLTELTSNTATTTLLMPVLAAAGLAAGVDPALLMIPAALSASCAFMMPVATAPNAIVYGTGEITVARMVREGVVLNLVGVVVIAGIATLTLG